MITKLLELVGNLVNEYRHRGPAILTNCVSVPEFRQLVEHLSNITLSHVGITAENRRDYFRKSSTTYFNIIEEEEFCVGVFCLPKGKTLKLHDHPNMLVVSKFLTGSIHHRALDLVDRTYQVELAKLLLHDETSDVVGKKLEAYVRSDRVLQAGDINYLTPERANIHSFTALEDTALLDIILPNYNETDHYCNYYIEMPLEAGFDVQAIWKYEAERNQEEDYKSSEDKMETEIDETQDGEVGCVCFDKSYKEYVFDTDGENNTETYYDYDNYDKEPISLGQESETQSGEIGCVCYDKAYKEYTLRSVGEKTTLIYDLPPLNEPITLVEYKGEKFDYYDLR